MIKRILLAIKYHSVLLSPLRYALGKPAGRVTRKVIKSNSLVDAAGMAANLYYSQSVSDKAGVKRCRDILSLMTGVTKADLDAIEKRHYDVDGDSIIIKEDR
jgi:hypothetical protein